MRNIVEKLKEYLDFKNIEIAVAERELGVSNASLSKPFKANTNIKTTTLEKFLSTYKDLNPLWVLDESPNMLRKGNSGQINESLHVYETKKTKEAIIGLQEVPFYDLEATAGLQELFDSGKPHKVLDTIKIPNLPRCDGAISVTGDSMYPLLKSGDIILYKETSVQNIFYGEMYLVSVKSDDWEEYITVKFVQKSEKGEDFVKLVSQNQHHQSKDINIGHISAIAMVKASIRYNTMF
ncbi:S24 family peptidase [Epilithonimonas xixisoli]|uniref:Peptidase S24-like protein n=1 Tax=Epilithonimonas xixisoli TaxID=1476462 RepID=A0A4V3H2T2_9FLAO|nr:S24 family peptidase [Epilithonimonas xixisoli]TDX86221.1 peptidase S24-like protein [Epilithonimonas xixisoli]